jgi:hypothetical protein
MHSLPHQALTGIGRNAVGIFRISGVFVFLAYTRTPRQGVAAIGAILEHWRQPCV